MMMPCKSFIAVLANTLVTTAVMAAAARLDPIIAGTASRNLLANSDRSNTASESQQSSTARRSSNPPGSSPGNPRRYTLDVTVAERAPDCVSRKVLLVNGEFQPTLELTQGDWVEVRQGSWFVLTVCTRGGDSLLIWLTSNGPFQSVCNTSSLHTTR